MPSPKIKLIDMDDPSADAEPGPPPSGPSRPAAREKRRKKIDQNKLGTLFRHFAYQYGSNIAWDVENRMPIMISNLRHTFGNDEVRFWLASEKRRQVMPEDIVFDPSGECGPGAVNLFGGFEMVPMAGNYQPILDLLYHLCDSNEEVYDWILDWCAYPLQNPGAKMPSAVIMHGDEGSGKNLFWECVGSLYGEYAKVVGQDQLEDKFNDYLSKTLFVIGDEVLSRQEMRHLKGKLKAMISGRTIQINTKMMPLRQEANHVNIVFLSNELQPNALDSSDRRYLVVWTPPKRERAFYQAAADNMRKGGREAFLHALLARDLSQFDPYAAPPDTKAKRDLQDISRPSAERFWLAWSAGELPVPFHSASSAQVYALYLRWCKAEGEKWPRAANWFGREVARLARDKLDVRPVRVGSFATQRMWLIAPPPAENDISAWSADCVAVFASLLAEWKEA